MSHIIGSQERLTSRAEAIRPSRNRSILGAEDEAGRSSRAGHKERRSGVPDKAGWRCGRRVRRVFGIVIFTGGRWNGASWQRDLGLEWIGEWLRYPSTVIKRRAPGGVVSDPERTGSRRKRHAPGVLQDRIDVRGCVVGEIGGQIGDYIAIWRIARIRAVIRTGSETGKSTDRDE